jgi:glycosyltransferase involved in cell wall biosynthesis
MAKIISVVVPFKNASSTIKRCIESLQNQTLNDFECILIDDGSNDDGYETARKLIDSRFQLIKNPTNLGVSIARNIGNAIAVGEIICVLDADDEALPNRLEHTSQIFSLEGSLDLLVCSTVTENSVLPKPLGIDQYCLMAQNPFVHSSVAYKRAFLKDNKLFYNPCLIVAHDYDLYRQIYFAGGKVAFSDVHATRRHHSPNGLMESNNKLMVQESLKIKTEIALSLFQEINYVEAGYLAMFLTYDSWISASQKTAVAKINKEIVSSNAVSSSFRLMFQNRLEYMI